MNERNQRQYRLMLAVLDGYPETLHRLRNIVASLEFLLGNLQSPEEDWKEQFVGNWGILEQVLAVCRDESRIKFNAYDKSLIEETVDILRKMVLDQIAEQA